MIHRVILSNFYSFRDRSVIDLAVPEAVPSTPDRLVSPSGGERRYPRVIGLYGPNASGKSTVLKALNFFSYFMAHSFSLPPNAPIPCYRFAAQEQGRLLVELEVEFDAPVDLASSDGAAERCPYVYGAAPAARLAHQKERPAVRTLEHHATGPAVCLYG